MDFICEHVVKREKKGMYKLKKPMIITALIIWPLLLVSVLMALGSIPGLIFFRWGIFLLPLFVWLDLKLAPIFSAYGEESYEYSVSSGTMSFATIYGDRFRKELVSFELPKIKACAPYDERDVAEIERGNIYKVYRCVSSMNAPYVYYIRFLDHQDRECIVYFEMIRKSQKMIKTYYPQTVITNIPD